MFGDTYFSKTVVTIFLLQTRVGNFTGFFFLYPVKKIRTDFSLTRLLEQATQSPSCKFSYSRILKCPVAKNGGRQFSFFFANGVIACTKF